MGGAERVSYNLARWLNSRKGVHARVVALFHFDGMSYPKSDIDFIELENGNTVMQLRKTIKESHADIVLTMTVPPCVYTVPALAGLHVKHIISERNDPGHFHGSYITKVLSRLLMKSADGYVFQTKQARNYYGERIANKSVIIHNPLSDIPIYERNTTIKNEIVSVGRLNPQKNHRLLIEAFSKVVVKYPDYHLTIYGEGPERPILLGMIEQLGLTNKVTMPGTTNQLFEKIKDVALFVMTSDFEGLPNALMEAMALGLPCISTDCSCGGPSELIENGVNGLLVPVGDKESLIEAMNLVLSDKNLSTELGEAAINIRNSHSIDIIGQKWLDFFTIVCSESVLAL